MLRPGLCIGLCLVTVAPVGAAEAPELPQRGRVLRYEGRLLDPTQKPLGGVYPLTFAIHQSPKGGKPVWSEGHFVAVDSGSYLIELGHQRPLAPHLGLEQAYLERIFGLFEQLDRNAEGSGMGLTIAKRIVEWHGGCIWAESPGLDRGSTFYFTLKGRESGRREGGA
jgi:hypothetical protein